MINLITFSGTIHIDQLHLLKQGMFTQNDRKENLCHQIFTKQTHSTSILLVQLPQLAGLKEPFSNQATKAKSYASSILLFQMETLFAQLNINWILGIYLTSHFGFFHSEELALS